MNLSNAVEFYSCLIAIMDHYGYDHQVYEKLPEEVDELQEAFDMAEDALCLIHYDMEENGIAIPNPSDITSLKLKETQFASLVSCDTVEYRKYFDNKAVKKTLTIPSWLNTMSERAGINFSSALQEALKEALHISDR